MSPRHWCPPAAAADAERGGGARPPRHRLPAAPRTVTTSPRRARRRRADSAYATHLPAGRFGTVTVYIPEGKPNSVAIFLSGDGGWELGVINMARALVQTGRRRHRRGHPSVLRQPRQGGRARRRALSDDRRGLRIPQSPGAEGNRHERLPGAGAGGLFLRCDRRLRHAGAVPARYLCRRAQPGLLRRAGFRRCEPVPRGRACTTPPTRSTSWCSQPAATLKQPWIALQGQKDQVCNPHAADEFAAQVANGQLVQLPLVGHGFSVERNWMPQFREAYARLASAHRAGRRRARAGHRRPAGAGSARQRRFRRDSRCC